MKISTYRKLSLVLFVMLLVGLSYAFISQLMIIAFFGAGFYLAIVSLLKTRVTGVIADERQRDIAGKAAQLSFQILMPMLLLTTLALMWGSDRQEFYYLQAVGTVLAYIVAMGVSIYTLTYWYLDRKTGGRS